MKGWFLCLVALHHRLIHCVQLRAIADIARRWPQLSERPPGNNVPGYMSRTIRKVRTDKFDTWIKPNSWLVQLVQTCDLYSCGWFPVHISCMSQKFRLFLASILSVINFWIFLLMYLGSISPAHIHSSVHGQGRTPVTTQCRAGRYKNSVLQNRLSTGSRTMATRRTIRCHWLIESAWVYRIFQDIRRSQTRSMRTYCWHQTAVIPVSKKIT